MSTPRRRWRKWLGGPRGRALTRGLAFGSGAFLAVAFLAWLAAPWFTPALETRSPRVPSVVWSRPAALDAKLPLTRTDIRQMLQRRGYIESFTPTTVDGRFEASGADLVVRRRSFSAGDLEVAADTFTLTFDDSGRLRAIHDGRGNASPRAELEPEILGRLYGSYWHDRLPITLADVPPQLVTAILEVEDRRFRSHHGLDYRRIAGAFVANVRAGRTVQGGSTISQQLVKNLWLSSERRLTRKLKEAYLAVGLERRYSKDRILEAYLNEVYLGQRGPVAVYGVGQAAYHYFGKHPRDLTLAECAFLAGMIQAPGRNSPHRHLEQATARRDLVLGLLLARGKITVEEHALAIEERFNVRAEPRFDQPAPFAAALVRRSLAKTHTDAQLEGEGLQIHTTIDARLQRQASVTVQRHLEDLERRIPRLKRVQGGPLQAAVVVLTPHTGEILALVGGRDWQTSQFDRATQAKRQPGSAFKPVVALSALTDESLAPRITLATQLDDSPLEVKTRDGLWRPVNYDHEFRGKVTLRRTLESSLNVPMVRVGQRVGPKRIVETARRMGIESPLQAVPSLALGSSPVSPLELTQAYAVLASEGLYSHPTALHAVRTADGKLAAYHGREVEVRFTPAETYLVTSALEDAGARGMRNLGWTGPIAGKTGTSTEARDLWFVAYTPDLVIGVWVGYDDGAPTGLSGSSAAAPIVSTLLGEALGTGYNVRFPVPAGVTRVDVHPRTGKAGCGNAEWFLLGTQPKDRCTFLEEVKWLLGS